MRHQYGISALVSETSFRGKTSGGVAKCRVSAVFSGYLLGQNKKLKERVSIKKLNFSVFQIAIIGRTESLVLYDIIQKLINNS